MVSMKKVQQGFTLVELMIVVAMGVSPSWGRAPCLGRSYRIVG
jgi:prepilin-type N-terminal cleavage/methylation domain-containing protein